MINGVGGSKYGDHGELYSGQWLVALPRNAPVTLSATENGFTQPVDVRSATRIGEAPTAEEVLGRCIASLFGFREAETFQPTAEEVLGSPRPLPPTGRCWCGR